MLRKFVEQLGLFYNLDCPVFSEKSSPFRRNYQEMSDFLSAKNHSELMLRVPASATFLNSLPRLAQGSAMTAQPNVLKVLMPILGRIYMPSLLLFIGLTIWLLAAPERRALYGLPTAAAAVGYAFNVGNNISIALFHTLGVGRYSHVQLATTLLTQGLVLYLFAEVAARQFASVRKSRLLTAAHA